LRAFYNQPVSAPLDAPFAPPAPASAHGSASGPPPDPASDPAHDPGGVGHNPDHPPQVHGDPAAVAAGGHAWHGVEHYENFPVGSWLVPRRLRPAVLAIYRFARHADDIADEGDADAHLRNARLQALHRELESAERGLAAREPVVAVSRLTCFATASAGATFTTCSMPSSRT
jgi:hypothetical protein